jgi:hypothetical protein
MGHVLLVRQVPTSQSINSSRSNVQQLLGHSARIPKNSRSILLLKLPQRSMLTPISWEQMGTRGNLCSLRKDAAGMLRLLPLIPILTGATEGVVFKATPSKLAEPYITQSPPLADSDRPSSSLKRKRDSPSTIAAAAQALMHTYPETQTALPASSNPITSYNLSPNNLPHSDGPALVNYVYEKQYPPNSTERHQILYRAGSDPRDAGNGPTTPPMNIYRMGGTGQTSKVEPGRDGSNSLSPSTQLIQATQHTPYENSYRNTSMAAQSEARNVGHPATPLIDTLPRKKQKQIYQIIGGVQSGIRSVRQQTESLQKQLDLLQAALGIDTDDENDDSLI